jgi:hypothetical protein
MPEGASVGDRRSMMTIHPAHALLLAGTRHDELLARADEFRRARRVAGAPAQPDCLIPVVKQAAPCRPDPRRGAARASARHRESRRSPVNLLSLVTRPHR